MICCEDKDVEKGEIRATFKDKEKPQPIKFKLLALLGLKEYLIDKYVFSRPQSKYEIVQQFDRTIIKTEGLIITPRKYEQVVTIIEDQKHSIPTVKLFLRDRERYCGTLVYSHGNSSDLSSSLNFISKFAETFPKFDYVVYDYTGYGKSSLTNITQQSICEDLQLLINSLHVPDEQIIIWGFSLGTYPTSKIASKRPQLKGVILQSPLASIYSLFTQELTPHSMFKNDCFNLLEHIAEIEPFLVIIHSKEDQVVPYNHSKILFQRYRMTNKNPFCFLLEVSVLKHNQMHSLLCTQDKNQVQQSIHSYLQLMIQQKVLPKVRVFQLEKAKYFQNLGQIKSAEFIDMEDKQVSLQKLQPSMSHTSSIDFTAAKQQRFFELDDITGQQRISINYYLQVKTDRHNSYFQTSEQAKDQTVVSDIRKEEEILQILQ